MQGDRLKMRQWEKVGEKLEKKGNNIIMKIGFFLKFGRF